MALSLGRSRDSSRPCDLGALRSCCQPMSRCLRIYASMRARHSTLLPTCHICQGLLRARRPMNTPRRTEGRSVLLQHKPLSLRSLWSGFALTKPFLWASSPDYGPAMTSLQGHTWTLWVLTTLSPPEVLAYICRDEDAAAKRSRIAQQREEALKRADAHAAEELIRAREHERQQAAKARCMRHSSTSMFRL